MLNLFIQHTLSGNAAKRLRYVLSFLTQHPLKPNSIDLITDKRIAETVVISYGEQQPADWSIPAQHLFFEESTSSRYTINTYTFKERSIYAVEEQAAKPKNLVIDRTFQFDLFETIFFHISRYEEYFATNEQLNQAGWLKESNQLLVAHQLQQQPVVDQLVKAFFEIITQQVIIKPWTFSLSHDVDILTRFTPAYKFFRSIGATLYHRRGWQQFRDSCVHFYQMQKEQVTDPYDYFSTLIREETYWTSKTIYFMSGGNTAYDNKYDIEAKKIDSILSLASENGYTIGLHPSYNAGFEEKMYRDEKQRLEEKVGREIRANRQHWLRFSWDRTPDIWTRNGIQLDSSMGYNQHLGFRCGTGYAYRMYDFKREQAFDWVEQPMLFMESAAIHQHLRTGVPLDKIMIDFLEQLSSPTHVEMNFHNSNFDPLLETGRILRRFYEQTLPKLIYEKTHSTDR